MACSFPQVQVAPSVHRTPRFYVPPWKKYIMAQNTTRESSRHWVGNVESRSCSRVLHLLLHVCGLGRHPSPHSTRGASPIQLQYQATCPTTSYARWQTHPPSDVLGNRPFLERFGGMTRSCGLFWCRVGVPKGQPSWTSTRCQKLSLPVIWRHGAYHPLLLEGGEFTLSDRNRSRACVMKYKGKEANVPRG